MSKSDYRSFFAGVRDVIKFAPFLRQIGVTSTTFSLFMRGSDHDYVMSLETLHRLYMAICDWCEKIA